VAERPGALVTGAAGFLGLALVRALSRAGFDVLAVDRVGQDAFVPRPGTAGERVRYRQHDVTGGLDPALLEGLSGIVHAAALTPLDEREGDTADQLLQVNVGGLAPVLAALRRANAAKRLLLVSSAGVYDQQRSGTLGEDDATGGSSLYGAGKLAAELVARRYAALHDLEYAAIRPTSLFGEGEAVRASRPRVTAVLRLVEAAAAGQAVRLERPESRGDWLCVDDAADAVVRLWSRPLDGRVYNVSSARPRRFAEVARAVAGATGLELDDGAETAVDGGPDRAAQIANDRLRAATGWAPSRSLEDVAAALLAARASLAQLGGD
jgi:nucleoside-diphosphate-sugar epimerase